MITTNKMKPFSEFEKGKKSEETIEVLSTKGSNGEWVGRVLTWTDNDGDTCRLSYYIIPQDNTSALLFLCFGECEGLTNLVSSLDGYNRPGAEKAWPMLMKALDNGANDNYSSTAAPALIGISDVPTGEANIWGVAVKVENVDFENIDCEYVLGKVAFAKDYALQMLDQFEKNDVAGIDRAIETGRKGFDVWRGVKTAGTVLSVVSTLLGGGSILPSFGSDD